MFNTKKNPHIHPCPCHIIDSISMKDQKGKKWTQKQLDSHIEDLNAIDEGVDNGE